MLVRNHEFVSSTCGPIKQRHSERLLMCVTEFDINTYCVNPTTGHRRKITTKFQYCILIIHACRCYRIFSRFNLRSRGHNISLSSFKKSLKIAILCVLYKRKQVAQLWQRDRAKLETISINVQRYSHNNAQNCIFGPPYVRIGRKVSGLFESVNAKKLCSRVSSREC